MRVSSEVITETKIRICYQDKGEKVKVESTNKIGDMTLHRLQSGMEIPCCIDIKKIEMARMGL